MDNHTLLVGQVVNNACL